MPDAHAAPAPSGATVPVRVWDLPTRLFHWALAACVVTSIVTAHVGGNAMTWHFRCGYAVFALLGFRLVWGFVGGRWSRFASFVGSPLQALRYLRGGDGPPAVGHNPLGAWSVLAMLGLLAAQVATGLVSDDEIASSGPLTRFVSGGTVEAATGYHADIGQWLLVALIVLHLAAITYYRVARQENLVGPMLSGDKALPATTPASGDGWGPRVAALMLLAAWGVFVGWLVSLGG